MRVRCNECAFLADRGPDGEVVEALPLARQRGRRALAIVSSLANVFRSPPSLTVIQLQSPAPVALPAPPAANARPAPALPPADAK